MTDFHYIYRNFLLPKQLLLRKKAAEELKKEQERKAAERRRIIEERCGKPKNVDDANEGILTNINHYIDINYTYTIRSYRKRFFV